MLLRRKDTTTLEIVALSPHEQHNCVTPIDLNTFTLHITMVSQFCSSSTLLPPYSAGCFTAATPPQSHQQRTASTRYLYTCALATLLFLKYHCDRVVFHYAIITVIAL